MILHHVAERSGMIVITAAMFHAHGFGDGDGHIINVTTIPHRLEQRIGKAERENILHRFFAEINLRFIKNGGENGIQGAGGFQVRNDGVAAKCKPRRGSVNHFGNKPPN